MIEAFVPQDILKHKAKFIASFSAREIISITLGGIAVIITNVGIITDSGASVDLRIFLSSFVSLPFLLVGFLKLYEQPFEKIAKNIFVENYLYPMKRKKETHHPELEKYEKTRAWMFLTEEEEQKQALARKKAAASAFPFNLIRNKEAAKNNKIKILPSKEFISIK